MKRLAVLLVVPALAVAACGSDEDDTPAAASTTAPAEATTAETAAGTTAEGTTAGTTAEGTTEGTTAATGGEATAPPPSGGCEPDSAVWHEPGTLTVATGEPAFPPYVIDDDPTSGEGFESAVVYAVAEQLGFAADAVTWVRTTFDEAIAPGPKDYDFNLQQYSPSEERDEIVDFSMPYYSGQNALLVLDDSPAAAATTFAEIQGLDFGATIGTTDYDYIVEVIGIPEADVAVFDDQAATFAALDAGQIDATVIGLPTALFISNVELPQTTIAGVLPRAGGEGEDMAMLFAEGNPARDCVDAALQALTDDGTLAALDEQWMQGGGDIPEITQ